MRKVRKNHFDLQYKGLDSTQFPTYRQIIDAYFMMSKGKSGKSWIDACAKMLAQEVIEIWLNLHPKINQITGRTVCNKLCSSISRAILLTRKRLRKKQACWFYDKLDTIVDLSKCRCELPEVNCSHPCIRCTKEECTKVHIVCVCSETVEVSSESYSYLKLQRKRGICEKNSNKIWTSVTKSPRDVIQRKNCNPPYGKGGKDVKMKDSRFMQALLTSGIPAHIAVSLGNALIYDVNSYSPRENLKATLLDEAYICREAGEIVKNGSYVNTSDQPHENSLRKKGQNKSRFLKALISTGMAPEIAVSLGNALMKDVHSFNPLNDLDAPSLNDEEIIKRAREISEYDSQ